VNYFPAQQAALDAALSNSLSALPAGPAEVNGRAIGSASAADIIALRANDGSSPNVSYPGPTNPGVGEWRPTPGQLTPPFTFPPGINEQWGSVTPFVLAAGDQFRPGPPPAVGSWQYNQALAAVKAIGSASNNVRTVDQTHIAEFYKQDAELTVNEAARELSALHGLSLGENALLFALTDIAAADARIAVWDAKYTYLFWRPVTALNANPDGSVTNNYANWEPLIADPAHPDYPSGHSGTVDAGFTVLQVFFGNRDALTLHTTTAGEPPRTVNSLSTGESENGLSRIYGGIHFPFDNVQGQELGVKVAAYVLEHSPLSFDWFNADAPGR
jgi:membrane-associated phospholipid phosphatase